MRSLINVVAAPATRSLIGFRRTHTIGSPPVILSHTHTHTHNPRRRRYLSSERSLVVPRKCRRHNDWHDGPSRSGKSHTTKLTWRRSSLRQVNGQDAHYSVSQNVCQSDARPDSMARGLRRPPLSSWRAHITRRTVSILCRLACRLVIDTAFAASNLFGLNLLSSTGFAQRHFRLFVLLSS